MDGLKFDENAPILVEFTPRPGIKEISYKKEKLEELTDKSAQALDAAMNTIHNMARRVTDTVDAMVTRPSQVEVAFGLKLETEVGALIAKVGGEASLNVKLVWEQS